VALGNNFELAEKGTNPVKKIQNIWPDALKLIRLLCW